MSDEMELETLLQNIQAALDSLNKCGDIDSLLVKLVTQGNHGLLKKVKNLTSDVHSKINSISATVSKSYRNVQEQSDEDGKYANHDVSDTDKHCPSPVFVDRKKKSKCHIKLTTNKPKEVQEVARNVSKKSERRSKTNSIQSKETEKNNDNSSPEDVQSDSETLANLAEDNSTKVTDDLISSDSQYIDTQILNKLSKDQIKVPKIKLVDINKLLAPNSTPIEMTPVMQEKSGKSVSFDSSVILLTSSDEDSPKKMANKMKDNNGTTALGQTNKTLNKPTRRQTKLDKMQKIEDSDSELDVRQNRQINKKTQMTGKLCKPIKERNSTRRQKKDLLEESSLSEGSSDELEKVTKTRRGRLKKINQDTAKQQSRPEIYNDDVKLKSQVFIRLPKFPCEDLQRLYKHKKEVIDIKKLAILPVLNSNSKNKANSHNEKNKLSLKLNNERKVKAKSDSNSESEKIEEDHSEENMECLCDVPILTSSTGDGDLMELSKTSLDQITDDLDENVEVTGRIRETNVAENSETGTEPEASEKVLTDVVGVTVDSEPDNKDTESDSENIKSKKLAPSDSNSDDETFSSFLAKRDKGKKEFVKEAKKKANKRKNIITDSEEEDSKNSDVDSTKDSVLSDSPKEEKKDGSPARKRIKKVRDSSSDDEDKSTRKQLRRMIDRDSLSETTKKAEQDEKERKQRIAEKQKKYNKIFELKADATVDNVVLDFDEQTNEPLLSIHKKLAKQLKPHQVHGIKFMWDASFESLKRAKEGKGSGCILAHCMGLGKTLQVIALVHALLTNSDKTKVKKVMVVCPVNTVLNWKNEFKKWVPKSTDLDVYELVTSKTTSINHERNYVVKCWHEDGGILIIGYNMFRNLSNPDNKAIPKKLRTSFHTSLVDPGPDLVVCDEGHLLKNEKTNLSIAMNRIKTMRRIVLTGTPLQNNLREYWCMVQFIKPNLLGTYKEYLNRFVNPITNGQYTDSTPRDIEVMRRRSHVLHKLLDGVVQRQDYAVLEPYLPPKHEYVVFLKLSELQCKLYRHYMEHFARRSDSGSNRTSFLFTDFQELQRICTHPRVLLDKSLEGNNHKKEKEEEETDSEGSLKDFIDDSDEESSGATSKSEGSSSEDESDNSKSDKDSKKKKKSVKSKNSGKRTRLTRAQAAQRLENGEELSDIEEVGEKYWWEEYVTREELDNVNLGSKVFLLFQILKECEEIGDKVLVFSQSLYTLNCIEYFLARIDEATQKGETEKVGGYSGSWSLGLDYFRLDGSSSCDNRASWCDEFNDPDNIRARLFLISTKAGGLGINLVAANRVIIFDVSWNPSHDIQSIYRVYRFGQTKPSYIYRFVTYGTMEMKIYERQVTKQAISKRVIDEQQIDRHYSQNDIQELYKTDLEPADRPVPLVPKDVLLGEMVQKHESIIFKYHEHQSLLENKQDEELNEEERKAAWEEFENEKVLRKTTVFGGVGNLGGFYNNQMNISPNAIHAALANIVRRDNPGWSEVQIKGVIPALITQLQIQMSENDFGMYNRVHTEIQMMHLLHQQRLFNQTMLLKQQQANQRLGNMNITPEELRLLQMEHAAPSVAAPFVQEIIDLND